ncbi:MAG: hypothetical protein M3P44_17070 [Actinomycetota bacterium]|nr:hypothetical protein [Actinomycetota bacterium]
MRRRTVWLTAVLALAGVAVAHAQETPLSVTATSPRVGLIALRLTGPPGATVTLSDTAPGGGGGGESVTLSEGGTADLPRGATWRCGAAHRTFAAHAVLSDGSTRDAVAALDTPTCARRLAITLPARPRAGRRGLVKIFDRWGVGALRADVCVRHPGQSVGACRPIALAPGQVGAATAITPRRPGLERIRVSLAGHTVQRSFKVRAARSRLRVLAAGDSMIQILDGDIERRLSRLGPVRLRSDAHISTGISKPFLLDWVAHARQTARTVHPDATVMFLGANDGFPMRSPAGRTSQCCNAGWVAEYARRARRMMASYGREGRGVVYWLLLPTPRPRAFKKVFRPVNRALRRAAASYPGEVRLIDLGHTFTPGGHFRQTIRWDHRTVSVRQRDGVHLSVGGAEIAADIVVGRMRRDGLIG